MALKLITETVSEVKSLIQEGVDGTGKSYFISGIFLQGNMRNQNGRIYPTETLLKEVNRYTLENIARKRSLGELGHPDQPTINLDRVSHLITELRQDGDNFVGRARIMVNTPMGNIVKALIEEGAELGVSSRGLGSLRDSQDGTIVQEDYHMSAIDIVADPSAPDAFGIMEGKEWVWESGVLREHDVSKMKQTVDRAHASTVKSAVKNEILVESFKSFLDSMKSGVKLSIH